METKEQPDNISIEEPQQDKTEQPIVDLNVKPLVGRPSEYSEEIIKKAEEYLLSCYDEDRQVVKQSSSDKGYEMYENKLKVRLPTKGGLARYLGVHRDTLYDWSQKYEDFSDIMEAVGAEQEDRLINMALSGDYNSTISKVLLTKHGYREGKELTGEGGSQLLPSKVTIEMPE